MVTVDVHNNYRCDTKKTTVYIINDNQIPIGNNKNPDQKLKNVHSHHLVHQLHRKNERSRYQESKLRARKATTKELKVLNL